MENVKILIDGIEKDVYGIFYIYDSKYYFIYTEKEIDENGYVILYMTQVGKETKNTENGPVDTGYMIGIEVKPEEQQKVQASVSYIVEDKKNNTVNPQIQYAPMSMLTNLKIVSKKRFRLLKSIMQENFKLSFDDSTSPEVITTNGNTTIQQTPVPAPVELNLPGQSQSNSVENDQLNKVLSENPNLQPLSSLANNTTPSDPSNISAVQPNPVNNVVVDYRTKYFEVDEKNKELQAQIDELIQKLNEIKKVIE